ncbi:hypothetical protein R3P38DRAFT_2786843 [Favolaschia claudopus]|uniref:Uncharacterized protein n=1 Tax=Favolaschia claudopus TaxID=2862362 RepID=A0AAW0ARY2_9AGAR
MTRSRLIRRHSIVRYKREVVSREAVGRCVQRGNRFENLGPETAGAVEEGELRRGSRLEETKTASADVDEATRAEPPKPDIFKQKATSSCVVAPGDRRVVKRSLVENDVVMKIRGVQLGDETSALPRMKETREIYFRPCISPDTSSR